MEKRLVIALVLSLAVLYAFRWLYPVEPPPPSAPVAEQVTSPAPSPTEETRPAAAPTAQPESLPTQNEIRGEKAEESVVETPLYTATVSNVGAVLKSFKLKDYSDAEGNQIELINATGASKIGWPLAVVTGDQKTDQTLSTAQFSIRTDGDEIVSEFASGGLRARKAVTFDPSSYQVSVESGFWKDGKSVPHRVVWQGGFGDQSIPADATTNNVVYTNKDSFSRLNLGGISEPKDMTVDKLGIEDQYFLTMFLLPQGAQPVKIENRDYAAQDGQNVKTAYISVTAPDTGTLKLYVGPKSQQALAQVDPRLPAVIDYGFFAVITRPLAFALLWIHNYVGNFGWSIILLTLLINLVLFPLKLKQQVSMQKMQKIQPQMRTLQDKYKKLKANDPKKAQVQSEMMGLYKEHGVNPLGGCLPLLLQMPFLYAIYKVLAVSIELRQAPWMLWIQDLSRFDPYFIMPILFGVSMLVMQKMTPAVGDPTQAKMMMIMPVLFTFMFRHAQSGLMLYWLTSNLAGIGQQVFISKYWAPQADAKTQRPGKKGPPSE